MLCWPRISVRCRQFVKISELGKFPTFINLSVSCYIRRLEWVQRFWLNILCFGKDILVVILLQFLFKKRNKNTTIAQDYWIIIVIQNAQQLSI